MPLPDLNLLITLNVLLEEGSVVKAAQRLQLSSSAMSRALARLREVTGDPLLVRAGRALVPTPRALVLREQVHQLVGDAQSVLRPLEQPDLSQIERTFTLRVRDGFVENFAADLLNRIHQQAPQIRLRFIQKPNQESNALRDGSVDLETGVIGDTTSPELRTQALFHDRFIGVVRKEHPLLQAEITPEQYVAYSHIAVARSENYRSKIDTALEAFGLERNVMLIVSDFAQALVLAQNTDLIASVPERHTTNLRQALHSFDLPLELPTFTVSLLWHPRMQADPVHRWLRQCVREVCGGRG